MNMLGTIVTLNAPYIIACAKTNINTTTTLAIISILILYIYSHFLYDFGGDCTFHLIVFTFNIYMLFSYIYTLSNLEKLKNIQNTKKP